MSIQNEPKEQLPCEKKKGMTIKELFAERERKRKEYRKEWREKNKEKIKEYHKQWREKNKEKLKEYSLSNYKQIAITTRINKIKTIENAINKFNEELLNSDILAWEYSIKEIYKIADDFKCVAKMVDDLANEILDRYIINK